MSEEQEMQFADPAWEPKVTREFEAISPVPPSAASAGGSGATAFQSEEAESSDYAQGYRPRGRQGSSYENPPQSQVPPYQSQQPPFQGQQQIPFSLQDFIRRVPTWCWWVVGFIVIGGIIQPAASSGNAAGGIFSLLFVAFLALIGWSLYTRRMRISLSGESQEAETRTFTVGAQPTIILKNKAGSINLRTGEEGQVSITTTRRGFLFSPRFDREAQIQYNQDSAANTVSARGGDLHLFGKNIVTFEVVVPPQSNLQLSTSFGQIAVRDVAGQIVLHSDAGTIQATDVALQGKSSIKGDAGTIVFSGSLDPNGSYEISTDLGTIDASLPAEASFDLQARTDLGTITTNFPIAQPRNNRASGSVGVGPYPRLKLKTDLGTITVKRG